MAECGQLTLAHYIRTTPAAYKNFQSRSKKVLHLWKFLVISHLRTNFAEMSGQTQLPGSRENQGRRGGESESLEEAAIEIGNS